MAEAESEHPFEAFKVPELVPPKETEDSGSIDCPTNQKPSECEVISDSNSVKAKKSKKLIDVPLPYKEPTWSGIPPFLYSFEIIKNGTFIDTYNIKTSLIVFGRLDACDIVFEHPSVSRFHAIIQYCQGDDGHAKGFYLYDLGSTHGTFLNKEKITPKVYYKLKVGYIFKFGGSTRLHIFQGPEEEEETEKPKPPKVEEEICTWGMGEDAEEEEDLSENPFALSTPNEELYLDDPKKTLRGWFEREGYELEYDVEEKGFKTFACRIQLPIDTPTGDFMAVEASVSGKKKEAVVACALEACRTLDRLGLLRQSNQESRQRKKKKWEENDYYDSDEDTFLDRTGTIEKKREMRKKTEKKPEAETFESLQNKLKLLTDEINGITSKLSVCKAEVQSEKSAEDDSLEAYMSTLTDSKDMASDKIERRKLKNRLIQAEKEKAHVERLLEIVKPTKLPPAIKYPGMIGKRPKSKLPKPISKVEKVIPVTKLDENEEEIEEDSDNESTDLNKPAKALNSSIASSSSKVTIKEEMHDSIKEHTSYGLILNVSKNNETKLSVENKAEISDNTVHMETEHEEAKESVKVIELESDSSPQPQPKKRRKEVKKQTEENIDVYKTESAEYSTWVPPVGQTGDGMTHLNAKYGY